MFKSLKDILTEQATDQFEQLNQTRDDPEYLVYMQSLRDPSGTIEMPTGRIRIQVDQIWNATVHSQKRHQDIEGRNFARA